MMINTKTTKIKLRGVPGIFFLGGGGSAVCTDKMLNSVFEYNFKMFIINYIFTVRLFKCCLLVSILIMHTIHSGGAKGGPAFETYDSLVGPP